MRESNNLRGLNFYYFLGVLVIVTVSCANKDKSSEKTPKNEIKIENKEINPVADEKTPVCYTKSDLDLPDTTSLHTILKKISQIKEVQTFAENNDKVLYCVTETEEDNIYQTNSYNVRVVLDTEDHYSVRFNFYINKQTKEIRILEVISDSLMTIDEWRKTQ